MKKLLSLLLAGAMALSLAACGGSAGAGRGDAADRAAAGPEQTAAPNPDAAPDTAQPDAQPAGPASSFQATIEPTVLVDEQGVKITASELLYTDYAAELALVIENNSDKDLSFYSGTLGCSRNSVNGYMVDGLYVGVDVSAGKKANETASVDLDELRFYGITDIADIEIAFDINDSDYNDYLQTEPAQVKTSLAGSYDYAADTYQAAMRSDDAVEALGGTLDHFAADEVYNEKGIRVVSQAFVTNGSEEQAILVELENTADHMVTVRTGDICLNGLLVQSGRWSADDINAGKRRVLTLSPGDMLDPAYWEVCGISTVEEVSFTLGLEDADGNALCDDVPLTFAIPGADAAYRSDGELLYSDAGMRILNLGLVPDAWSGSGDIHLFLLVENGTEREVQADVDYDTLSVNGYMTDTLCFGPALAPGQSGLIDVPMDGDSLAENGVEAPEDIQSIELTFEFQDEYYNELAAPTVVIGAGAQPAEPAAAAGNGAAAPADTGAGTPDAGGDGGTPDSGNDIGTPDAGNGAGTGDIPGVSPDFKEMMDSYEAFFDEYAAFMETYQSGGTVDMMSYLSFLTQYAEAMQKLDAIDTDSLSAADMAYYTQVMLRISAKLTGTAGITG